MKVLSKIENNEDAITKKYVDDKAGVTAVDPTSGAVATDFFIPTKTSDLTNDSGFITSAALAGKQDTLVSGTNIKTINNESLLGDGNITIQGGGSATDVQVNGTSITSNGVANLVTEGTYSSSNKIATINEVVKQNNSVAGYTSLIQNAGRYVHAYAANPATSEGVFAYLYPDNISLFKLSGDPVPMSGIATPTNDNDAVNKKYVDDAITALPEPMIFKGSLGTGGTITSLPAASSANEGFTYKVITAGTYASQTAKVGDTFISDGTAWILIPSGDEPNGTVTSVTLQASSPIAIDNSTAITTSGTRTISHATSGVTAGTYRSVTVNATGHVTAGTNPTTLSGYGITDAKIASGTITLGSNTITPLTADSTLNAAKLSGAIPSAVTATTQSSGDNSTKIATTAYVDNAVSGTSGAMIYKGTLGTGGTITTLPTASASNVGYTYKVITDGTYASQTAKAGDMFTCSQTGTSTYAWVIIPSGDENESSLEITRGLTEGANVATLSLDGDDFTLYAPLPTTWTWTNGTSNGPTASLSGTGMSAVSVGAIPAANGTTQSGIITTGNQTIGGVKTFSSAPKLSTNTITTSSGNTITLPSDTSTLATTTQVNAKQDTLVSGTNIKKINNTSLLGSGNINTLTASSLAPTYDSSSTYKANDLVIYNNQLYQNIYDTGTTTGTWNSSKWTARTIADLFGDMNYIGELTGDVPTSLSWFAQMLQNERSEYTTWNSIADYYSSAETYAVGDYVMHGNGDSDPYSWTPAQLYKCTTAITTPEDWNISHWRLTNILEIMEDKIDAVLEASY